MNKQELIEWSQFHLLPVNDDTESHRDGSIMTYNVICKHDTGFMCECRAKHIVDKVANELKCNS